MIMSKMVRYLSSFMSVLAGFILIAMILVTLADIVMRFCGRPIIGAYEIVAFLGVAVIALALPRASFLKTHVYVDFLTEKLSVKSKKVLRIVTRLIIFCMFLVASWYFILMGKSYMETKTVTMSLKVPFYPVIFALAASCFMQCLVSIYEIFSEYGGSNG